MDFVQKVKLEFNILIIFILFYRFSVKMTGIINKRDKSSVAILNIASALKGSIHETSF